MVQIKDNKTYIKILYWGMASSGKTTIVDTLYKSSKESNSDIEPIGDLKKIEKASGATLYFDRGVFQSKKKDTLFYQVYTVAGQRSFSALRRQIFQGTDGVIFVVDSQIKYFEDNIEALKELKNVSEDRLIKELPLIIMLNKQDLDNILGVEDFKQILKDEKLWFEPDNKLHVWNPIIYETCALFNQRKDIHRSFSECARRTFLMLNPI